jgi:starch phosphorylase
VSTCRIRISPSACAGCSRRSTRISTRRTRGARERARPAQEPVIYFTAEFGFHETLPIAAGGLGILAGDHAKSASDLGLGFVGISLFYREGYFQQSINQDNWQVDYYTQLQPKNLPIEPVVDKNGEPIVCSVQMGVSDVKFKAWRVNVGRCPAYLLDTNLPENEQHYRDLTLRVYGGDSTTRILQEILLGIGGVRLMRALGVEPSVYHMNEGHAAFLALELIREKLALGKSFADALNFAKKQCIFTTHTPVEAGHDRFTASLMDYAFKGYLSHLKMSLDEVMALGRVNPNDAHEPFCMTVLALKAARAANGVSELHGQVSRHMWQCLWPGVPEDKIPIGHITNGIHLLGWMKGPVRRFWRRRLTNNGTRPLREPPDPNTDFWNKNNSWESAINDPAFWQKMGDPNFISDEEIWALRYKLRRELIEFARRRLLLQGRSLSQATSSRSITC